MANLVVQAASTALSAGVETAAVGRALGVADTLTIDAYFVGSLAGAAVTFARVVQALAGGSVAAIGGTGVAVVACLGLAYNALAV